MKHNKKLQSDIRYKEKQFNPNAAKNYYNIRKQLMKKQFKSKTGILGSFRQQALLKRAEKRYTLKMKEKEEIHEVNFVESAEFNHVSEDSIKAIKEIEKETVAEENKKPIYNVNSGSKKRRKQKDVDRELVEEFYKNPNSRTFYNLWKRYYVGVKAYAYRIMGDNSRADDMTQQTFQKAWENRHKYDPKKTVYVTWLYAMCKNLCIDTLRYDSKSHIVDIDVSDMFDNVIYRDMVNNKQHTDENYYVVDEDTLTLKTNTYDDIVKKMFDTSIGEMSDFDPIFKDIITLKEIDGMSISDVARQLGISESRVKNIYYKNKTLLAERIMRKHKELFFEYQCALSDRTENTFTPIFKFTPTPDEEAEETTDFISATDY